MFRFRSEFRSSWLPWRWSANLRQAALIVVGVAGALGLAVWFTAPPRRANSEVLVVHPADLNFGRVWVTNEFPWKLRLTNTSSRPIVIDRIDASCTCAVLDAKALEVAPGETKEVALKIDLSSAVYHKEALRPHPFEVHFRPLIDRGLEANSGWVLRGEVRSAIDRLSQSLDFGQWVKGEDNRVPRFAQVQLVDNDDQLEVHCLSDKADVSVKTGDEQRERSVELFYSGSLSSESFRVPAVFVVTGQSGESKGRYLVMLTGLIADDIYVTPRDLSFGILAPGSQTTETLIVASRQGRRFQLLTPDVQGDGLTVLLPENTSAPPYRLVVKYSPRSDDISKQPLAIAIRVLDDQAQERFLRLHPAVHILRSDSATDSQRQDNSHFSAE